MVQQHPPLALEGPAHNPADNPALVLKVAEQPTADHVAEPAV
jgi:hypothetical protein